MYIAVDPQSKDVEWVRAGHDPAFLYFPTSGNYTELYGKGVALGVDSNLEYESNRIEIAEEKQLIVIGSDGAWEAENFQGEMFGKQRLIDILKENSSEDPEKIITLINSRIDLFLEGKPPQDDITFVVIQIDGERI